MKPPVSPPETALGQKKASNIDTATQYVNEGAAINNVRINSTHSALQTLPTFQVRTWAFLQKDTT